MSLLILGCGYVGSAIAERFPQARVTQRNTFILSDRKTWKKELLSLPEGGIVLWTFPAASTPEEEVLAVELYENFFRGLKVVLYGSTSAYQVHQEDEWVTEKTLLDMTQARTRAEEQLRSRGACVLQLSGIFGPDRDPILWYKRGLIKNGLNYLNLIHLKNIISITSMIFSSDGVAGERFNLSHGNPKTHLEIVEILKKMGVLPFSFLIPATRRAGSKRVSNEKIKQFLQLKQEDFIDFPIKS